jgi:hypothetical protein
MSAAAAGAAMRARNPRLYRWLVHFMRSEQAFVRSIKLGMAR